MPRFAALTPNYGKCHNNWQKLPRHRGFALMNRSRNSMVLPKAPKRAFGRTRQGRASPEMLPGFNVVKEAAEWIRCPLCTGDRPCASPLHDTQKQTWLNVAQAQSHTPASSSSGSSTWARGDGDPDKTRMSARWRSCRLDGSGAVVDVQEGSRPCVSGHQRLESVWGCLSATSTSPSMTEC